MHSHEYQTLRQFVEDVETAEHSILQPDGQRTPPTGDVADRTKIFKRHLDNLIRRHPFKTAVLEDTSPQNQASELETNGLGGIAREDKSVLTVFGNAPRGRQLFSSLPRSDRQEHGSDTDISTINEAGLPSGVATSSVIPFNTSNFEEPKNRTRTLGEVFAPRASLPSLQPPGKRDLPANDSSVVTWLSPVDSAAVAASSPGDKRYFSSSTVAMDPWINYGYQLPSRRSRRKQRTGSGVDNEKGNASQYSQKEEVALLPGTYSSFAPSFDSGGSVVSSRGKGQLWWRKSGAKHFRTLLSGREGEPDATTEVPLVTLDEDTLKDTVETFEPEVVEPEISNKEGIDTNEKEKEMDAILQDISELLQTLDSYRQLRSLQPATSQAHGSERPTDADSGTTPSDAEFEIYKTLKSGLSATIATLPPYALSKLDGEQLAELNISKKILLDGVDYPGTMEEDDYTLHQRQMAKVPQATAPARSSTANVGRTPPVAPYQRYPPRTRHSSSSGVQAQQQTYANRTPSAPYQPHSSPQQPTSLQPSSQRPSYPQQPQYPQQSPTPQYTRASMLQQFQRPTQNGNSPNVAQRTLSSVQPQPSPPYPRSSQPNYQQRAPDSTYRSPVPGARTASPQKSGAAPQRQYMSPATNHSQPRYFQQQQQPHQQQQGPQPGPYPHFPSNQASTATPPYSNTSSGMAYSRNAAEQAALMEHNKAQPTASQGGSPNIPRPSNSPHSNGQPYPTRAASQENSPNT